MKFEVELNGTKIPVDVDVTEYTETVQAAAKRRVIEDIISSFVEKEDADHDYSLTPDEVEGIVLGAQYYLTKEDPASYTEFIKDLVSGYLKTVVAEECQKVVENRKKYFRVTMKAVQYFDIWVKAEDEYMAENYAADLTYHDLSEYLSEYDTEFEVDEVSDEHDEPDCSLGEVFGEDD